MDPRFWGIIDIKYKYSYHTSLNRLESYWSPLVLWGHYSENQVCIYRTKEKHG